MSTQHTPLLIIGAGFGGIGLGAQLRRAGIQDFAILERTSDLGGTWSRNTYPGAACDVPSSLYSFAFAPNPAWSRKYATQPEILDYLRGVAAKYSVEEHIQLDTEVLAASFDEEARVWRVSTNRGEFTADIVVSAVGAFAEAAVPDINGLGDFEGPVMHTLHWDHTLDLTGLRVGVVGTGASAVQIVPELAASANEVVVFQRTPPWIVPRGDRPLSARRKALYAGFPFLQKLDRMFWYAGIESFGLPGFVHREFRRPFESMARKHLARQVKDDALRRRLTPDYMIGCKRAIFSDAYYPALASPNVVLETGGIREVDTVGVITSDGTRHDLDAIVLATGFTPLPRLAHVLKSSDGRTLGDIYTERPQSYLGVAYAGFPNMFAVLAPFGAAGNQSAVVMIEAQIRYIVDALQRIRSEGVTRFEVDPQVQEHFVDQMHRRARRGTWLSGGCMSYYTNGRGENSGLYPGWSYEYRYRVRRWDRENYIVSNGIPAREGAA